MQRTLSVKSVTVNATGVATFKFSQALGMNTSDITKDSV